VNVLIVSGIWPPDVGGPASHAPQVAHFLQGRGHGVAIVTTATARPAPEPFPVYWISRSLPKGLVHVRTGVEVGNAQSVLDGDLDGFIRAELERRAKLN